MIIYILHNYVHNSRRCLYQSCCIIIIHTYNLYYIIILMHIFVFMVYQNPVTLIYYVGIHDVATYVYHQLSNNWRIKFAHAERNETLILYTLGIKSVHFIS